MATWPTITQNDQTWVWTLWGGGITAREVFAFNLSSSAPNNTAGALISNVTVFPGPKYQVQLNAEPPSGQANPGNLAITGNFDSNGV